MEFPSYSGSAVLSPDPEFTDQPQMSEVSTDAPGNGLLEMDARGDCSPQASS